MWLGLLFVWLGIGSVFGYQSGLEDQKLGDGSSLNARLDWFQDLKFGFFVHFGIYSQWGCIESWPLVEADKWARPDSLKAWIERDRNLDRFRTDYWNLNRTFNPQRFNPTEWAEIARDAGMKYFVFTTKHHDGFSMFDTRASDYRVTNRDCPFSRDPRANIALEAFNAFREAGFAIGAYYSKADWHHPDYWDPSRPAPTRNPNYDTAAEPEKWSRFVNFVHRQIEELVTGYGPIDILWLDAGQVRPPSQDIRMDDLVAMARSHQPRLLVVDRTVGGRHENYRTPEQKVPETPPSFVWETCMTMGDQWSFKPGDNYKSTRELVHLLVDIVAKGGNFLLNVGPQPDGRLPEKAVQRMREIGAWMKVNGAAIYGTRPIPPYKQGAIAFTRKGNTLFAIRLFEEGERVPGDVSIDGFRPVPGSKVELLGYPEALRWESTEDGTRLFLPEGGNRSSSPPLALVFRLRTDD